LPDYLYLANVFEAHTIYFKFNSFRCLLIGLSCVLFSSCADQQHPSPKPDFMQQIIKDSTSFFRGIDLDMTLAAVKSKEDTIPSEEEGDYLFYEVKVDSSNSYTISYSFDDKGLSEVQVDIFIDNEKKAADLYTGFKNYFDRKLGQGDSKNGFTTWIKKEEQQSGEREVELLDESGDYNYGKLSLSFYRTY